MADKKADKDDKPPPSFDDIMSPKEMKPLLAKAKRGHEISFVIGLTADKDGMILFDRKIEPKRLRAELKKQAAAIGLEIDPNSLRFGKATIDKLDDPKLIQFTVNKDAPGALRLKLLDLVKRAGFADCSISASGKR